MVSHVLTNVETQSQGYNLYKFSSQDTLKTTAVAADRSGNEHAVKICKKLGYVMKRNKAMNEKDMNRLCDAWLLSGFIANFMYKNVI